MKTSENHGLFSEFNHLFFHLSVVIWLLSMQCVATKLTKKMFVALELLLWKLLVVRSTKTTEFVYLLD
jgi:hypothetical protein